jgi:hypothetical protein
LISELDEAIGRPFAPSSVYWLAQADRLTGKDAVRLSFWLKHVAHAIARK